MSPRALGAGVAALTAVLWFADAMPPPHPLTWTSLDLRWYFFPQYAAFYGALRDGAPLLWNPYQLCGVPLVGTLQAGFFYPFHVLYLLLPTGWALAASTALHVALAAGATAAFARRAGASPAGATLAGLVFATTGTMRHWQLWPYLLEACAWLPVGALGVLDLGDVRRRSRGALLLVAAAGASWLAGGPQGTVFAVYTWGGLLVARLALAPHEVGARVRAIAAAAGALVAGALLGAAALLPAYDVAREGLRATSTMSPEFLFPMSSPIPSHVALAWFWSEPWVLLPAFLLAPLALRSAPGWLSAFAAGVGGLALLISLGPRIPVFPLYNLLPALGWFREPTRLLVIAGFCLAVAAGLGLDTLVRVLGRTMAGPVVVAGVVAGLVVHALQMQRADPPLPFARTAVPWTAANSEAYARLADAAGGDRVWPFNTTVFANSLPPKLPSLTRLHSIEDYEPLALRRQSEFFVYFLEGSTRFWQMTRAFDGRMGRLTAPRGRGSPGTRRRLLDLTATRFVLVPPPALYRADLAAFVREAGLVAVAAPPAAVTAAGLTLFENPHALPRAYVTSRARRAPAAREVLETMAAESFDPLVESWIEADTDLVPPAGAPPRGAAATIVRDDPQVVEIRATLAAPGLVVLADTYAHGWRATVDGVPAPILATNHLFRGVTAPAGEHLVRFEYRPWSLWIGVAVSLATALGLGMLAWVLRVGTPRTKDG